jgi:hypothetical protein
LALLPRPSRLLSLWWCALHALLVAAALLVAWPSALRIAALALIAAHAVARWPRVTPVSVLVGADATCLVPEWGIGRAPLGPRTIVCTYWLRLDVGVGPLRRDLLLFTDQLGPDEWARLRAALERARCDTAHVFQRFREPI